MTLTRYRLSDIGGALSWRSIYSFISNLPPSSATYRAMHKDTWTWDSGAALPYIVADLIDYVGAFIFQHAVANSDPKKQKPKRPEPYPRPNIKKKNDTIGKDPIKVEDFEKWWNG